MRVAAVGDNCVDVYYKQNVFYPTGNAVDFAINLKKLGAQVALVSVLGNDAFAQSIRHVLEQYGIDCSRLCQGDKPSAMAQMALVEGDRVHEQFWGNVLADFCMSEEVMDYVKGFDVIYSEKWSRIGRYISKLQGEGRVLIHDFSKRLTDPTNEEILPYLDYAFFSYDKLDDSIKAFLRQTQAKGARTVIAMLGADGSLAYDGERFHHQAAKKVEIVNTVGAGDSYVAAFAKGLCEGDSLEGCMRRGTELATQVIQMFEPY